MPLWFKGGRWLEVNSTKEQELWDRLRLGDRQAETELFLEYMHLVDETVMRVRRKLPNHVRTDDMRAAALEGLWNAIRGFDPSHRTKFEAYARIRVRGAILDELRKLDDYSRRQREQAKKAQAAYGEQQMFKQTSLEDDDRIEWIVDDSAVSPEAAAVRSSEVAELNRALIRLSNQEQLVLSMVFVENLNLTETAEVLSLSRSRVSAIYNGALKSLKGSLLRRRIGSFE